MDFIVVGASGAGAFAALLLARAGHQVLVLERDHLEPATDVEAAAAVAFRPMAPQIVQPHIVMARCRELLRTRLPNVYRALLEAGVAEAPIANLMPSSLTDQTARPGDERLTLLMTRRSTVDWVLQRALRTEPGIILRYGVRVLGLLATSENPPRVTGVHTDQGDVSASMVVDTTGRRSAIDGWLAEIGAGPSATWRAECGVAYYSRHYRLCPVVDLPGPPTTRLVAGLDEFLVGIWAADNGVMQLAVGPLATDHRFRAVKDPRVFEAVLRTVPTYSAWLEVLDPISGVFPMGAVHNALRRLVVADAPVALGLHAIGDAVCTTNPTFGRGLSLALWGAADLVDVVASHGEDLAAQALALDARVVAHVAPYYEDQAVTDSARLAALRHAIYGTPVSEPSPSRSDRVTYAELRTAAWFDPTAFRAFWKVMGMIGLPDAVYADPDVVAATRAALHRHGNAPMVQPTRVQLLAALTS